MATNYVMKMSVNGQVSIPAETRARWRADRLLVVDLGDRLAVRPLPTEPIEDLRGKYRKRGPSTERARRRARSEEAAADQRR